uniref:Protein phosphotase, putative n=1 Tax=Leishmania guyanensis TaxID=5670 RepID=A0A1E1IXC5_LEIGU|nr:protein phosphotase, putative [Leishmania guyanensis]
MPQLMKGNPRAHESVYASSLASSVSQVPLLPQDSSTGPWRVIAVPRHGGGAVVQWHRDSREVKVTVGDAAAHRSWVNAARLFANPNADTVQLTVLHSGLRAYIDGQRLLRIGSPVEVQATQRISFGADPTSYAAVPAPHNLSPGARAACTPPPLATPVYSAVVSREGQIATERRHGQEMSSSCTPRSSRSSPCLDYSLLPMCFDKEFVRDSATATSPSPEALKVRVAPTKMGTQQNSAPCKATSASLLLARQRASEPHGHTLTGASRSIAVTTTSVAEDVNAVRQARKKCAISATLTEKASTGLCVKCTATVARCSSDTVGTATGAALLVVYSEEERAGAAACSPSLALPCEHSAILPFLYGEVAELEQPRVKALCRALEYESRARTQLHTRPCWTLDPVTNVRSPDWEVLHAMQSDVPPLRSHGIYQLSCGSVGFDDAMMAFRRDHAGLPASSARGVVQRPRPLRPHLQRPGVAPLRVSHHSSGAFSLQFTERTSIDAEGGGRETETHARLLSGDEMATQPSSVLSSGLATAGNAWRRPHIWERLHLCPRMTVNPFIVEAFGNTHRYRPLVQLNDTQNADSSYSSAKSSGGEASVGVFDRFAGVPWQHPIIADEIVTPRTEGFLRDVLRRHPDSTSAAEDAAFLHCAMRRSYDADTDRFSYVDSPTYVQVIFSRFSTLLTAVKARLRESRPVLRLSSPLLCGGDLLGSFADLLVLLDSVAYFAHWSTMHTPLLLLGNYVDVGWHSVEVCVLLCCWAYLQPSKVHLLRGPHEDPAVNGNYRFLGKRCLRYKCRQRFGSRRGIALWTQLNDVFALLPVAAVVDERVFATHGGVPLLRASMSPGGKEGKGIAVGHQRGNKAPVQSLYTCTSASPTPTASNTSTLLPFSPHTGAGVSSVEWLTAYAYEGAGVNVMQGVRLAELHSTSTPHHCPPTPVMTKLPDTSTEGYAEVQKRATSAGLLPLEPLSGDPVDESDGCPTASTECAATRAAAVSTTDLPSWSTSPCDTTPLPHLGVTGLALESRYEINAAVVLSPETTEARTSAPLSPSSRTTSPRPITAAAPYDLQKPSRAASVCNRTCTAADKLQSVAEGGRVTTKDSTGTSHEVASVPSRSPYGDISLGGAPTQVSVPPAAASNSPIACSSASACGTSSGVWSAQGHEADRVSPSTHASVDEDEPSEDDFDALLAAMHTSEYAFRTLQRTIALEGGGVTRRFRLVRELLWNRPREAAAKLLMPEEELIGDGRDAPAVLWWRPRRVEGCCCCPAGRAHRCCRTFGSRALIHFFLRFRFSLLIRGASEDPTELYGAELSEEGRLLTLNTCRRRCKMALQAAACVIESQMLRLATWGPQELADSLGQQSLSSLPGVQEAEAARADFQQFVCDAMRDHHIVGPGDQWSVLSAYKAYKQQQSADGT